MDYKQVARKVIKFVGGKENVSHLEHCSTRLRFSLYDNNKVDTEQLEAIDGVMAVKMSGQCQVVIGNEVVEVYDEVVNELGDTVVESENTTNQSKEKRKIGSVILDFLVGVFQPLVPAIAGGGVLKSTLMLLSLLGLMDAESQTYQIFTMIGDAPLYFLPILVAITTANKLKANALVAASAVGALLLPNLLSMIEDGAQLFSFNLQSIAYAYQVFPAILTVILFAQVEKLWTKVSPKPIRIFFVPMMSLVVTVPIALLLLGPFGYTLGQGLSSVILTIFESVGWIAVALLAAVLPFMVATGMHKAMLPYAITTMGEMGREILYLPASLAHNIAESGACFAVSMRTSDKKLKATAISAGISAFFGITEPALYGVTIQNKKVLSSVMIGSFIGGTFIGLVGLQAFALVGPGVASLPMFISEDLPRNIIYAIFGLLISFLATFIVTLILFKEKKEDKAKSNSSNTSLSHHTDLTIYSPVKGELIPLTDVKDDVFSTKVMGDGLAIQPEEGALFAPADGKIEMVFNTKHALGIELDNGAQLLFHVGIDTVQLQGEYFEAHVEVGEEVKQGQQLLTFDLNKIITEGFEPTIVCVVTNNEDYQVEVQNQDKQVTEESEIMTITKIGE
ncbi:PTS system beta-glucoside-specific EIIBCA component [Paraliobacillus ryukyuensis]|uniref:PTS system beta-glucoside-specific IIA component (Glc family) /PTS system beta-glucoside-specific IIB component (Glc family) /PTS system beta-glucoside-specific IIC component (Glc family) n=1 Tax=Paraliobacillus ryukyuensis TaxID=200904 RepID=A0A366ED26_9BACI|nr:beta-glucoside-specific PTS transporter subunit IIABC [Paraliobacillus ryukyuensis]RBP00301.1 PTS system beta-glucoside-specific IIA component (Glc family) /PTS system beta-glucoside-specific IIB component (Glc family) /PTS system beta-glucoside-specific IIC component (Glc family) [Paraliobacillus ryukyuensis]